MKTLRIAIALISIGIFMMSCNTQSKFGISEAPFGTLEDGTPVSLFTLTNPGGMTVAISNYGGTVINLLVPDSKGRAEDVVLGFNDIASYVKDSPYFGCLVGRFGNRIAHGRFELDGKAYSLAANNEPGGIPCHLHGGVKGYDKVMWEAEPVHETDRVGLKLHYLSADGEEGYPGNLDVTVIYWLLADNTLRLEYQAETDQPTPVNLTHHSYFNLAGEGNDTILDHSIMIAADKTTPVDAGLIPTGDFAPVAGTPFDFTAPHSIGERIDADNEQLKFAGGYDHNFVLNRQGTGLEKAAEVYEPVSGRVMEVWTVEPGLQFYSGNFLDGTLTGKSGKVYPYRSGFCLETQHFPDSPNQPAFPGTILKPGEKYETVTEYRFSVR